MFKKFLCVILLCFLIVSGCSNKEGTKSENSNEEKVKLLVTKNFANSIMYSEYIALEKDTSVLEIMDNNMEIETAYNGGFINSINGLESGYTNKKEREKKDWFFYINGTLSQVSSLSYIPGKNDIIQWDYHDWSSKYVSSLIGAFPNEFTKGYGDKKLETDIASNKIFGEQASLLTDFLKRNDVIISNSYDLANYEIKSTDNNLILIGLWEDIKSKQYISGLIEKGNKIGIFFDIEDTVKIKNYKNEIILEEKEGCIVTSFIRDYSSMSKLFIITGNHKDSIIKGVNILSKDSEKINGLFSVLITPEGEVINIPYEKEVKSND